LDPYLPKFADAIKSTRVSAGLQPAPDGIETLE
jgi:hypothetical protein